MTVELTSTPATLASSDNEQTRAGRKIVATGTRSITATGSPGFYVARLRAPNGRSVEHLVKLEVGDNQSVTLNPPPIGPKSMAKLRQAAGFSSDGSMTILSESSGLGPLAWVRLSTVLSSAANTEVFPPFMLSARRLRSIGLSSLRNVLSSSNDGSALQAVFGDEYTAAQSAAKTQALGASAGGEAASTMQAHYLRSIRIAWWPIDKSSPEPETTPRELQAFDFIAEYSVPLQPGCHWLSVGNDDDGRILIPTIISPARVTNLVFTRNQAKKVFIFVYQPSPSADPKHVLQVELRARDGRTIPY